MQLGNWMDESIFNIAKTISRFYLRNAKGRKFLASFVPKLHKASKLREQQENLGVHIPPFLIASISSSCNLHCAGCYARADGQCNDLEDNHEMQRQDWANVFDQSQKLGISFILLAGGEPLLKPELITLAASYRDIVFPVFTNGLLLEGELLTVFEENRNLIPVISIEGNAQQTDARRGKGVSLRVQSVLESLHARKMLFALSLTVTSENLTTVATAAFLEELKSLGCGIVFFVEYVPVEKNTEHLVLSEGQVGFLNTQIARLKKMQQDMVLISFPGDEQKMGGCLAAGRGFFHISNTGAAEPCPFSPFSKYNLKENSLLEVLSSDFFEQVRNISKNAQEHQGGCTLFLHEEEIRAL